MVNIFLNDCTDSNLLLRKDVCGMMDKMKRISGRVLLVVLGVCVLSMIVTGLLAGKPSIFGVRPFFVMTGSMEPTIRAHSLVLAVPVDAAEIKTGDIVTYTREAADTGGHFHIRLTVVHRVRAVKGDVFIFQGDNETEPDPPVSAGQIGYRVVWIWK